LDAERSEPIVEIRVVDNGAGFTDANMAAFDELDTYHKVELGAKGVGRLTWLKVFEKAAVSSVYQAGDGYRHRTFDFVLPNGVTNDCDVAHTADPALSTTVILSGPRPPYQEVLRYRATTIAAALLRHFLFDLLADISPTMDVVDNSTVLPVRVDDLIVRNTGHFELRGSWFTIEHLKLRSPEKRQHLVYYCANGRPVKEERLKHLPDSPFVDSDSPYFYHGYVFSPYLDVRVNEQRTAFDIQEDPEVHELSYSELRDTVRSATSGFLTPQLAELAESRDARIRRVLEQRLPDLQYVREQNSTEIAAIPLDATDGQVEDAISVLHLRNQKASRDLMSDLLRDLRGVTTLDLQALEDRLSDRIERITRPSQASLASYVLYRRSIVELYREVLKKSADRFQREAAIHKLMFPMRTDLNTSRAFLDHNLWLLDERLTYANYIASDRPLRDHEVLFDVHSRDEPDIACYFNLGFSEDDPAHGDFRTVVIVELKRPGPLAARDENPWEQAMRYIGDIREGTWSEGGQKVKASPNTRFYCFIVCDLDNPTIDRMVRDYQFRQVFDATDGYSLYHDHFKAYVEVVPFERILRDAERKHRAFFDRLGLRVSSA